MKTLCTWSKPVVSVLITALMLCLVACWNPAGPDGADDDGSFAAGIPIERVSVGDGGEQANAESLDASISSDGRYVAFASDADNLVAGDTNGVREVYLRDRKTGVIERIGVDANGNEGNEHSYFPSISADGRYVAFYSEASNLVSGDLNARGDVFLRDRQSGTVELISVDSGGNQSDDGSSLPAVSSDARYVFFQSAGQTWSAATRTARVTFSCAIARPVRPNG